MKNQKKINTKQFLYLTGWHHHTRYSRCKTYPAEGKKRQSAGRRHKKGGKGRSVARLTWYLTGNIAAFSCFICFRFLSLTLSSFTLIFMLTARTLWRYPNPSPSLYFTTCQITTPLSLSLSLSLSPALFSLSLSRAFSSFSLFFSALQSKFCNRKEEARQVELSEGVTSDTNSFLLWRKNENILYSLTHSLTLSL